TPTKLFQGASEFWRRCRVEVVARVQRSIAAEAEGGSMQSVGAGLQGDVDDCAGLPAILCRRVLLDIEFLDGVDGQDGGRVAGNATSVHDCLAGVRLAVE